jgi:hypothetical protein
MRDTIELPAFLCTAIINGDTSGLSVEDETMLAKVYEWANKNHVTIVDVGESYFGRLTDWNPAGPFVGDIAEYTLLPR